MNKPAHHRRPNPDALLASTRSDSGGVLRLFFGAAPGVGKTSAMLRAARARAREGDDVLLGVIESHGRADTERLCRDLAALPPIAREYRGRHFHEFDLDATLARRPAIVLVDELAHRNIPGGRHARRWQDIEELLDAGLEVWTTLNVQHVESLNDDVARITGIRMRETVPDRLIARARDVSLIDLTPQELIERLQQGKVYVPEQARAALAHYFSPGNLTALRELALQVMAQRLDHDVRRVMDASGVAGPWPVRARLLVVVRGLRGDHALLRSASRWAQRHQAPWEVIQLASPQTHDTAAAGECGDLRQQAGQLGGRWSTLAGDDPLAELLDHAAHHNVTAVMIARSPDRYHWWQPPLVDRLLRRRPPFDVIVCAALERRAEPPSRPRPWVGLADWLWPLPCVGLATLVAQFLASQVELANLSLVFLAAVLFCALRAGTRSAMLAVLLSTLSFNFFFTAPRFTLVMIEQNQLLTVAIFCLVGLAAGQLAGRARRQLKLLRQSRHQIQELLAISRALASAAGRDQVRSIAVTALADHLHLPCVFVESETPTATAQVSAAHPGDIHLTAEALQAARWSLQKGRPCGHGTHTLAAQRWRFIPVNEERSSSGHVVSGVLGLALADRRDDSQPGAPRSELEESEQALVDSLVNQLGNALARTHLVADLSAARVAEENERLRSALLSSVSHDLRTPLASIIGSASSLRDLGAELSASDRSELLDGILGESERLDRYIQNLLDMTRLGQGELKLERDWVALSDIVAAALRRLASVIAPLCVERHFEPDLPLLHVHPALIEQALVNVIENAARFSPVGGRLRIAAACENSHMVIRIADQGPGIPEAQREEIFDMFTSLGVGDRRPSGSGLGLAICRGMIGAHGGEISATAADWGAGTEIVIRLPLGEPPAEESDTPPLPNRKET
ncbi:sensor histidine kinase [Kushneria aurantia]|uniref:histidine kinase n=1 Tax=Kushneria aurantia TaxID=504092 RepID=A0ABV6G7A2_9GAMM|nr:sensor histidine kinase KdpD [Kushneria aurantia]